MEYSIELYPEDNESWKDDLRHLYPNPTYTPDLPLLRKLVDWAEEEEARQDRGDGTDKDVIWMQMNWLSTDFVWKNGEATDQICSTGCCIAGKVALDFGTPIFTDWEGTTEYVRDDNDGLVYSIREFGREQLGLQKPEADELFEGENKAADIREIAERIAARAGEML